MKVRAVLFDIYGTLFRVGLPPADADLQWQQLFEEMLGGPPPLNRLHFAAACSRAVARRHETARARGISHPEVLWPAVVTEVIPELRRLPQSQLDRFIYRQMQIGRHIELYPGAVPVLRMLSTRHCFLGLVSNAQAYTLLELKLHLGRAGLDLEHFRPDLRFFSFEHGYAKPDPHVFQWITNRLESLGVGPTETLVVGDRLDNDIEPARIFGLQTWHLQTGTGDGRTSGSWDRLRAWLEQTTAGAASGSDPRS
jgi:FMN phosphatase YigB (HAD superfamily)